MVPYSGEVLSALLEDYNRAIWPAQVVASLLAIALTWIGVRGAASGGRLVAAGLAVAWAWTGAVFHLMYFATINFAASTFAAAFVVQAALLLWTGTVRGGLTLGLSATTPARAGLGLVAYAVIGSPLLAATAGDGWESARVVGLTPGPTAVFTLGILLLSARRAPVHLAVIPVLWSLFAGWTAWHIGVAEDLVLPLLAITATATILWKNRS